MVCPKSELVRISAFHCNFFDVCFLFVQDEIVEKIQQGLDSKLLGSNVSRTFYTQTLLPGATAVPSSDSKSNDLTGNGKAGNNKTGKEEAKNMVRTDSREQKLDRFLKRTRYSSNLFMH